MTLITTKLLELPQTEWTNLRDLYAKARTNSNGYDLIQNFINWTLLDAGEEVKIFVADQEWRRDGTYILIHKFSTRTEIYFNTLNFCLSRLKQMLTCLSIPTTHLFCGYPAHLKPAVVHYYMQSGRKLSELQQHGVYWYHLSRDKVADFDVAVPFGLTLSRLELKHAQHINDNWPHCSDGSIEYIKRLIRSNINVGAFDHAGNLIAWCLRTPHGSLGLLHVTDSYKRRGLGSLLVRYMAKMIVASGAEVLATVLFSNTASRVMFEKLGFSSIGHIYWGIIPSL